MNSIIEGIRRHAPYLGMGLLLVACNSQQGPRDFREVEIQPRRGAGTMPMDAVHGFSGGGGMPMAEPQENAPEIEFDAPEGWVDEPGTGMRAATFKIADKEGEKEASIVILPSAKDGYASNVKRWLGQLGMQLPDPQLASFIEEREGFNTIQNIPGSLFDFTRLKGVADQGKGFMLAAMIEKEGRSIFVKLTGNADFLQRNKEKFLALSQSIRVNEGVAMGASEENDAGTGSGMTGGASMGGDGATSQAQVGGMPGSASGSMSMQSSDPAFNQVPDGVSRLIWKTPTGWKSLGPKGMRTGSFSVTQDGKSADGSIVQLSGPAGGLESNVRRWMEQAGIAQLDDQAMKAFLKSQKKIRTVDGYDGVLVNLASLMNGNLIQENSILATLILAPNETIFVKLVGPRTILLQNVEALAQLSSSLSIAK